MKVLLLAVFVCYVAAVGQWEDIDSNDNSYDGAVQHSLEHLNKEFKSKFHHKVVEIIGVRRQVVAGLKFEVKLAVQETTCTKSGTSLEEARECDLKEGSFPKYCTVTTWEKSWEKFSKVLSFSCSSRRT